MSDRPLDAWLAGFQVSYEFRVQASEGRAERQVYFEMGRAVKRALPEGADRRTVTLERLAADLASGALVMGVLAATLVGGEMGYDWGNAQLTARGARGVSFPAMNPLLAEWARNHAGERIAGIDAASLRYLRKEYAAWQESGKATSALVKKLRAPSGPFGRHRARAIAITETTAGQAWAARETYRLSGVVAGTEIATANDERVCDICGPLEGRSVMAALDGAFTHPGGDGAAGRYAGAVFESPPFHTNCRCRLVPVLA